ncbi:hypothetical protein, arginine-rich [Symbiobacterium thermophilum IAM 14863]|uniref:Uncharacterized protein n=1 Tax=Symbiobacterium thermophilum (strain DSM 24528 / JCM 14929 / IAM 14863 / T) TaxID=292459 RepID=Q67LK0_SYMTH|nr:hypothetical protein, arginine-rich [Symbiobacterium thermophilum IAM 14863]
MRNQDAAGAASWFSRIPGPHSLPVQRWVGVRDAGRVSRAGGRSGAKAAERTPRQRMCTFVESLRGRRFGARGAANAYGARASRKCTFASVVGFSAHVRTYWGPECRADQCRGNRCALSPSPYAAGISGLAGWEKPMGRGFHESAHSRQRRGRGQERNRGRGRAETRAGTTGTNVHLPRILTQQAFPGPRGGKSPWGAGFTKVHVRVNGRVQGECVNVSGPRASTGVVPRQRMCTFGESLRGRRFGARWPGEAYGTRVSRKCTFAPTSGARAGPSPGRGRTETRAGTTGTKVHSRVNGRPSGRVHERVRAPSFDGGSAEAKDPGRSGRGVGAVAQVTR